MKKDRLLYLFSLLTFQVVMLFFLLTVFSNLYLMYKEGVSTASIYGTTMSLLFSIGSITMLVKHKAGQYYFYLISIVAFIILLFLPESTTFHPQKKIVGLLVLNIIFSLLAYPLYSSPFVSNKKTNYDLKKELLNTASYIAMIIMIAACLVTAVNASSGLKSDDNQAIVWLKVSAYLLFALSIRLSLWSKVVGLITLYVSATISIVARATIQGEPIGDVALQWRWLCAVTLFITILTCLYHRKKSTA